jgi:2-polyprenyl-6-methoxyphenol hydroxylase-like FAD-dependent oxidoreductase
VSYNILEAVIEFLLTLKQESLLAHRVDLHTQLKTTAIASKGAGTPVRLVTDARVVDVDTQSATITLKDGTTVQGDLVIGADGVHSRLRSKLTAHKPFASGKSAFRFLLKKADVMTNPRLAPIFEKEGEMIFWMDTTRYAVMYQILQRLGRCTDSILSSSPDDW